MIPKKLEEISQVDIQGLIDNKVVEGKQIEYKSEISLDTASQRKEFLADISSFANSTGGDLIIGVDSDSSTGEPIEAAGIEIQNVDQEILKIENLIRDGIKPRIWGLQLKPIEIENLDTVLIVRIPNSWISPHRVDFQGHNKFYTRGTNGKYPMDVDELRIAFNMTEMISERIKNFRIERLNTIYSNQSYIPLNEDAKIVLHIIPFSSFSSGYSKRIKNINEYATALSPLESLSWDYQFNLDGFMCYTPNGSYTQAYNNGIIEAVNSYILGSMGNNVIPSTLVEKMILEAYTNYIRIYEEQNIFPPIVIALSFTNIKSYDFAAGGYTPMYGNKHKHGKEILILPENIIYDYSNHRDRAFQPIFDSLWNSYGHQCSKNFDSQGNWIKK